MGKPKPSTATISRRNVLLAAAALGAGYAGAGVAAPQQTPTPAPQTPERPADVLDGYRFGPGDQLKITVYSEPDLSGPYVLGSKGDIAFPLLGDVPALGLTASELEASLTQRLQVRYLRNPRITIEVMAYRPFYILGEVSNPGTYPFVANLTVQNAVAIAGGFTYRANKRRVFIKHADRNEEVEYSLKSTTPVLPGDTVRILERRF